MTEPCPTFGIRCINRDTSHRKENVYVYLAVTFDYRVYEFRMVDGNSFRERDWKIIFGVGTLVGALLTALGISLTSPQGVGNSPVDISGSDPEYTLRLIQAIGILLPLFTGLLRLTTSDHAEVGQDINKYLFTGILLLVVGGVVAVAGGLTADMAGVLRAALVFVLLTFVMIAVVAGMMFTKMPTETVPTDETNGEAADDEREQSVDDPESDKTEPTPTTTGAQEAKAESEQTDDANTECD